MGNTSSIISLTVYFYLVAAEQCPFVQEWDRTQGKATDCPHLGGGVIGDVETCKQQARKAGANAFNFGQWIADGTEYCLYKSCADPNTLQLTTVHGGMDVYVANCEAEGECIP